MAPINDTLYFTWYTYDASALVNDDWSRYDPNDPDDIEDEALARELVDALADNGYSIVDVLDDTHFGTPDPAFSVGSRNLLPGDIVTYVALLY